MSEDIGLAFRQALLQVLQDSWREMMKVNAEGIPELLVGVERSAGFKIKE
jgi:hypothetical protein